MSANSNTYIVGDYSSNVEEVLAGNDMSITGSKAFPVVNYIGTGGTSGITKINSLAGDASGNLSIISSLQSLSINNTNPTIDININNTYTSRENCVLRYRGAYDTSTNYLIGDVVTYDFDVNQTNSQIDFNQTGYQFVCVANNTINVAPPVGTPQPNIWNNANWRFFNRIINNYMDLVTTDPVMFFRYRGLWTNTRTYEIGDIVRYYNYYNNDGYLFYCTTKNTGQPLPAVFQNNGYWRNYSNIYYNEDSGVQGVRAYTRFLGLYDASYNYVCGDCVQNSNFADIYICRAQAVNIPTSNTAYWYKLIDNTSSGSSYTAGNGIDISNNVIKNNITQGQGISITGTNLLTISSTNFRPSYTIFVAPNGSDITGNGSKTNPFATINYACQFRATLTDAIECNIYIEAGNYNENITISTGRTYITCDSTSEARESVNITGNIAVNIPTISTVGLEYAVGISNLQINGNITAQASASGAFILSIYETNINQGNLVLTRTGASGSTCVVENCRFNPTGDIGTIVNQGFILQVIGSQILTSASTQTAITIADAPSIASAGYLIFEYSSIQQNSTTSTVGNLIRYTNNNQSIGNRINWSRLSYASANSDAGTGNKMCVGFAGTGATFFDYVAFNIFENDGATTGGGNPHIWNRYGTGSVNILYKGGNYSGTLANKFDASITGGNLVLSS